MLFVYFYTVKKTEHFFFHKGMLLYKNENQTTDTTGSDSTTNSEINKTLIGVLAILFGAYGIHHFLMGHIKRGVLSILFFWTLIPTVFSIIEGIRILCMSEEQFQRKYLSEQ